MNSCARLTVAAMRLSSLTAISAYQSLQGVNTQIQCMMMPLGSTNACHVSVKGTDLASPEVTLLNGASVSVARLCMQNLPKMP